ncbi:hypothetical protein NDU88_002618 [Pleurodeles waltl]|uniref:Nuclease HARBI1 n=1 Tax=Pleurodeles waltl TaxID=8319 RepID=A0AAV7Q7M4_PLEWA|nr:hypothetical protein NDU88_002618 [Pleurodeles waltl]
MLVGGVAAVPVVTLGTEVSATAREIPSEEETQSLVSAPVSFVELPLPSVPLVPSDSVNSPSRALWVAAPSVSGANAPPPDDANTHKDRRARPLGQVTRWRHPPVYRPLVDLSTMEDRHVIITNRLDRSTVQELCAQLEPNLMPAIRHPTAIRPLVQVLSVFHFLASGSFQTTVAMASGMSQPMFSNVLSRVLSALLKHMRSYILFPQVEDLPTVKGDFYALGHIPNIIGAIDGTHVAFVPQQE